MALADSYLEIDEYRDLVNHTGDLDTAQLLEDSTAASRIFDFEVGVVEGGFNPITATQFEFDSYGGSLLYLRDGSGRQYFLRTITANLLTLDTDADGVYDNYTLDLDETFVRGFPANALAHGQAFTAVQLLPHSGTALSAWPIGPATVRITGSWGFATIPVGIKRAVAFITRDMRDRLTASSTGEFQMMDSGVVVRDDTWRTVQQLKRMYSRRLPVVA